MSEPRLVEAEEAQGMSRQEALRTLAAAGDRRAELMLAGPVVSDADVQRLRSFRLRLKPMALAVRLAMLELQAEREAAEAEFAELRGAR